MEIKAISGIISKKIKSPFVPKSTSTNPFENYSHAGNTFKASVLPFADVFQTTKKQNCISKVKILSASVIGAVSNYKNRISQSVINFTNNIKSRYNIIVNSVKTIPNKVNNLGLSIKNAITNKYTEFANVEPKNKTKILNINQINIKSSIADLKATWLEENRLESVKGVIK